MSGGEVTCMRCGATAVHDDRFCERCGTVLVPVRRVAVPRVAPDEPSVCADCGDGTYVDQYCTGCGQRRAEPDRDQARLGGVVLVTDRGLEHPRNEDAAAAGVVSYESRQAIAVALCDGVSTSSAADTAAKAAATVGVAAMLNALAACREPEAAVLAGLAEAAKAAVAAGSGTADRDIAASCTYAAVAVAPTAAGTEIAVGNVGDSRVYWIPDPPAQARCLTIDDSVAQELISAGAAAQSDVVQSGAHTLTRWLGADAGPTPWSESGVRPITVAEPGVLLLCSDGLWNYLPDAEDIAKFCTGNDAADAAQALVDHALSAGGNDNITVAVIPIGGRS
ncbi:PP2C family serine/threonine-protein phosphatase [Mycobacterium sp. ITM-2016-00318]|uniref:PP2C family protein-serine/threonine phosphatase n=1 Tax=Mycobacterium sp. ITM-2016-00318 TaxID=2099693 RepID=UPI001E47A982|nr:protein phosphatase 2C domain-containing protein [Mycobacterium sp. ITM-2016-00318]WNG93725.1 protein phosphatase 2C domain-containing protein [Mycobacterium sp. ITM-2016-00318]